MPKILFPAIMALFLSACVTGSSWALVPSAGTIKSDSKIAYIANNKGFDDMILFNLRKNGLVNVKKFSPGDSIPDEYNYILSLIPSISQGTNSSSYEVDLDVTVFSVISDMFKKENKSKKNDKEKKKNIKTFVDADSYNYINSITFNLNDRSDEPVAVAKLNCSKDVNDSKCLAQTIPDFVQTIIKR